MSKKNKAEYESGKIKGMVNFIANSYGLDENLLRAQVYSKFPELKNKACCANCGASMRTYYYTATELDARLLIQMARIVHKRLATGLDFTKANRVHFSTELSNFTLAARGNITSKLGLIAKVVKTGPNGYHTHDTKAGWLITKRGYEFLAGKKIPKCVRVFRNQIQERTDEMTSMTDLVKNTGEINEIATLSGVIEAEMAQGHLL